MSGCLLGWTGRPFMSLGWGILCFPVLLYLFCSLVTLEFLVGLAFSGQARCSALLVCSAVRAILC